jgi:hypothetical protein
MQQKLIQNADTIIRVRKEVLLGLLKNCDLLLANSDEEEDLNNTDDSNSKNLCSSITRIDDDEVFN